MNRKTFLSLTLCLTAAFSVKAAAGEGVIPFNTGWTFVREDVDSKIQPRIVNLPHDWSIENIPGTESPFDAKVDRGVASGFTRGGVGSYTKSLTVSREQLDGKIMINFDGVYSNSTIYVNGQEVNSHFYGYTPFSVNITPFLHADSANIITVRVNTPTVTSRWYSGSGIYRPVQIEYLPSVHIIPQKLSITTASATPSHAVLNILSAVENITPSTKDGRISYEIIDPTGKIVASAMNLCKIAEGKTDSLKATIHLPYPQLWNLDSPKLYTLRATITDGKNSHSVSEKFGIRTIEFNSQKGFLLNGNPVKLKGGCIHHDNGPLGAKAFPRAEERKIQLLKQAGFNALRTAHNPPSRDLLNACDSLGMLLIDEAFDVWLTGHFQDDYSSKFRALWRDDIEAMIDRDRNHPSIIMWSIGNEIKNNDTDSIAKLADEMARFVRCLDSTRPVTAGVNSVSKKKYPYLRALDVAGFNYSPGQYVKAHRKNPNQLIYASESYSSEAAQYWKWVEKYPWIIGDFVWTAMDYIGEASIGWYGYYLSQDFYPFYLAYCGDIDVCGNRRPQSYYRSIVWDSIPSVYIAVTPPEPSFPINPKKEKWSVWDWPDEVNQWKFSGHEGKTLSVKAYSNCESVELFQDGYSLGRKQLSDTIKTFKYEWPVVYKPSTLRVVGYDGDAVVAEYSISTPGECKSITMTPDRTELKADGMDLSFITVRLTDETGATDTSADDNVRFELTGPGELIAVGNGNPMSTEGFVSDHRHAWHGQLLAVVKASDKPGEIILRAVSDKGMETFVTLRSK